MDRIGSTAYAPPRKLRRDEKPPSCPAHFANTAWPLVPEMFHRAGGPGANFFGYSQARRRTEPSPSDASNINLRLNQCVQAGIAPEKMVASKYLYDNPAGGNAFQRPLCPFLEIARYIGNSDPTNAANWMCTIRNSLKIR